MRRETAWVWRYVLLVAVLAGVLYALVGDETREPEPEPEPMPPVRPYQRNAAGEPICPECGRTDRVHKILYGLLREGLPPGIVGGGCTVWPNSPEYQCGACGTSFGRTPAANPQPGGERVW